MAETDQCRADYSKINARMWRALEENILMILIISSETKRLLRSDEFYLDVLQAWILRPKVFLKREPCQKRINQFILNVIGLTRTRNLSLKSTSVLPT